MKHLPLRELGWAVGVVALLAAIYMGSYYALAERDGYVFAVDSDGGEISGACVYPNYRFLSEPQWPDQPQDVATVFFSPAHAIDLRIRPDYWSKEAFIEAERRRALEAVGLP
jgi:hypothetical protein